MRLALVLAAATALTTGCAAIQQPGTERGYIEATAMDLGSTAAVYATHTGVEGNPLGLAGVVAAKAAFYGVAQIVPPEHKALVLRTGSAFGVGASVSNTLLILGVANPVGLVAGIVAGMCVYNAEEQQ